MEEKFKIAGIDILFDMPQEYVRGELGYLTPFVSESVQKEPHRYSVSLVNLVDSPRGMLGKAEPGLQIYQDGQWEYRYRGAATNNAFTAYMRTAHSGKEHLVQLHRDYASWLGDKMMMEAMALDHLLAQEGGILLHASFVAYQDRAIIFTAPSGTGKSTQADLWVKYRNAELINGDRVCIRVTEEGVFAYGVPFAGSSQIAKNKTLPVTSVICLEQAQETSVRRVNGFQAFRRIWEGCALNPSNESDMMKASGVVQRILEEVPVLLLAFTPDETAITALEEMLSD